MGDYRTLLLPGIMIAVGLLGLGGWMYFNKRNKKVAK
jgi:LPXTG-motif cell wall-anchored protein